MFKQDYFAKANAFFLAVDTRQIKNTRCLTSMSEQRSDTAVCKRARGQHSLGCCYYSHLRQIRKLRQMQGRGFPKVEEVNDFVGMEVFNGEGRRLSSISSMCSSRGIPTAKQVDDFAGMEVFKGEEGQRLLFPFPPCSGRGIPTAKEVMTSSGWRFSRRGKQAIPLFPPCAVVEGHHRRGR